MATSKERQFWLEFLELYKSKPELWKIKCEDYKNRAKKTVAYNVLIAKCKEMEPNADKDFVAKKINCFRSTYRRELKKVKSSAGNDDEYIPSLWYYKCLGFLKDQEEALADSENEDNKGVNQKESEPKSKKKKTCSSTDELVRLATQRLKDPQDSCHQIGIVWGSKLSKMNRNQRIIAEKVINEVMFNGELGLLNFNTTLVNISSACNLNASSSSFSKNNTIINSSGSSVESTPTKNYTMQYCHSPTPNDAIRQRFSEHLKYRSPSPPLINAESIVDHEIGHTSQNFVVSEYDPLDNTVKIEE